MHFFSVTVKRAFRAPKRTKTCVECNNIVTTKSIPQPHFRPLQKNYVGEKPTALILTIVTTILLEQPRTSRPVRFT